MQHRTTALVATLRDARLPGGARRWLVPIALLALTLALTTRDLPRVAADSHSDRYGVGTVGALDQVRDFGLSWVANAGDPTRTVLPEGLNATFSLPVNPVRDEDTLARFVAAQPGAYWLIGNEPNVIPEYNISPSGSADPVAYADALHYYATTLKALDPNAKLIGPNIINWEFTCVGCGGFQSGASWTAEMRDAYLGRYGQEPPVDIWGIHVYDLDWINLPNGDAQRQIDQISGFRVWLDSIPALAGAPIWITELGLHWGYPGLEFGDDRRIHPTGDYAYDHVEAYMRTVFGWLNENADALNIQRWFLWLLQAPTDYREQTLATYAGIRLVDESGAPTRLGQLYKELAGAQ